MTRSAARRTTSTDASHKHERKPCRAPEGPARLFCESSHGVLGGGSGLAVEAPDLVLARDRGGGGAGPLVDLCSGGGADLADVHAFAAVGGDELVVLGGAEAGHRAEGELLVGASVTGPLLDGRAVVGGEGRDVEALAAVLVDDGVGAVGI